MPVKTKPKRAKKQKPVQESKSPWRPILIWGGVFLGIAALGTLLFLSLRGPAAIRDLVTFARKSREHVNTPIEVSDLPPAGGAHGPIWQNCGIYEEPIPAENVLHSLEHGAIWLTYQPDLPEEDVAELQDVVRREGFMLLSPYPGLKSPVVLTAWEVQLELDSVQDGRLGQFIERYSGRGPEPGATCSNGVGSPIP